MADQKKRQPYLRQLIRFYFAPQLRSFLTVLYLVFFLYFVVFYSDNVFLAARFILYTLTRSTLSLDLSHLLWGSIFIIALLIPFSVSVYTIVLPLEISKRVRERMKKLLLIALTAVLALNIVIIVDRIIQFIEDQAPIATFLERSNIRGRE
ncbi:MAG: hypothetical protein G01um101472_355 [Parcubacteria group bacterium Gr01-1014_72]|jgi:hypothetical protein|nr:MAG: hypothetical protein G01um101472_355 [Parcubacteria group bacterium Gr01-1014_72]